MWFYGTRGDHQYICSPAGWAKRYRGAATATAQGIFGVALDSNHFITGASWGGCIAVSGPCSEVLKLEEQYMRILLFGGGGMVLSSAIGSFFLGKGRPVW